ELTARVCRMLFGAMSPLGEWNSRAARVLLTSNRSRSRNILLPTRSILPFGTLLTGLMINGGRKAWHFTKSTKAPDAGKQATIRLRMFHGLTQLPFAVG